MFAEVDKGNPTIEEELLPPDYLDHDPPLPGMAPGWEGVKQANALLRAAFPDTVHTIEDQIAAGDKVATRWVAVGTNSLALGSVPATGRQVRVDGLILDRVAEGRVVERWEQWDQMGMMQQLGLA